VFRITRAQRCLSAISRSGGDFCTRHRRPISGWSRRRWRLGVLFSVAFGSTEETAFNIRGQAQSTDRHNDTRPWGQSHSLTGVLCLLRWLPPRRSTSTRRSESPRFVRQEQRSSGGQEMTVRSRKIGPVARYTVYGVNKTLPSGAAARRETRERVQNRRATERGGTRCCSSTLAVAFAHASHSSARSTKDERKVVAWKKSATYGAVDEAAV